MMHAPKDWVGFPQMLWQVGGGALAKFGSLKGAAADLPLVRTVLRRRGEQDTRSMALRMIACTATAEQAKRRGPWTVVRNGWFVDIVVLLREQNPTLIGVHVC